MAADVMRCAKASRTLGAMVAAICLLVVRPVIAQEGPAGAAAGNPDPRDLELQRRLALSHRRRAETQAIEKAELALISQNESPPAAAAGRPRVRAAPHRAGRPPARHRDDVPAAPPDPKQQ
jgi:hypothetical protein